MLAKQRARITNGCWDHKLSLLPEAGLGVRSKVWIFLEAAAGLHMLNAVWFLRTSGFSWRWKIPISSGLIQVVSRAKVLFK